MLPRCPVKSRRRRDAIRDPFPRLAHKPMLQCDIIVRQSAAYIGVQRSRTSRPTMDSIVMKNLIRVAFAALSLITITPVANADNARPPVQQDSLGSPAPGWG